MSEMLPYVLRRSAAMNPVAPGTRVVLIDINEHTHSAHYHPHYRALAVRSLDTGHRSALMVVVAPENDWKTWHEGRHDGHDCGCPNARTWPADLVWIAE